MCTTDLVYSSVNWVDQYYIGGGKKGRFSYMRGDHSSSLRGDVRPAELPVYVSSARWKIRPRHAVIFWRGLLDCYGGTRESL